MATLVHASTDWQVFVNKNGGMCEKFDELHGLKPSRNIITSGNISPNPPRSGYINDKYVP